MTERIDLTGQKFGAWVVLGFSHVNKYRHLYWRCRCSECKGEKPVRGSILGKESTKCKTCHNRNMQRKYK